MLTGQLPNSANEELDIKPSYVFNIEFHYKELKAVVRVNMTISSLLPCLHLPCSFCLQRGLLFGRDVSWQGIELCSYGGSCVENQHER